MEQLTIVANIVAKPDCIEVVRDELQKLIDITRAEEGCINYDLHVDNDNPAQFMFYENWESYDLWQEHMEGQHLQDFSSVTEGMLEDFNVMEMTQISE